VTSIYVGNLAYEATEQELREVFEQYGEVSSVTIIVDRATGRPRGFAFVEMPDGAAAAQAIENLHLARIAGRAVTVNEARPKTQKPRRPGGGRNWSGGRRSW